MKKVTQEKVLLFTGLNVEKTFTAYYVEESYCSKYSK